MRIFFPIVASFLVLSLSAAPNDSSAPASVKTASVVRDVSPDEAEKLLKDVPGLIVVDVRTSAEFADAHIKGATNIDFFEDDFEKRIAALDPAKAILIHCAGGNRSSQALKKLGDSLKFPAVYHLKSGFSGWKAAGKAIDGKGGKGTK